MLRGVFVGGEGEANANFEQKSNAKPPEYQTDVCSTSKNFTIQIKFLIAENFSNKTDVGKETDDI